MSDTLSPRARVLLTALVGTYRRARATGLSEEQAASHSATDWRGSNGALADIDAIDVVLPADSRSPATPREVIHTTPEILNELASGGYLEHRRFGRLFFPSESGLSDASPTG